MITLDLPETLERHFWNVVRDSYKGNAYIEFDALPDEVYEQTNHLTGATEFFLRGNVDLSTRNPQGFDHS